MRRRFEAYAPGFDRHYQPRPWIFRLVDRLLRHSIELRVEKVLALARQIDAKEVLDVGCGPGRYAVALAKEGRRVVGVDFSNPMLEVARSLAQAEGVLDNCRFYISDFLNFSHPDRFDLVIALGFLEYTSSPLPYLERMKKFAKGLVVASFPARDHPLNWQRRARYSLKEVPVYFYSRSQIVLLARKAGLKPLNIERLARDYLLTAKSRVVD